MDTIEYPVSFGLSFLMAFIFLIPVCPLLALITSFFKFKKTAIFFILWSIFSLSLTALIGSFNIHSLYFLLSILNLICIILSIYFLFKRTRP